MVTIVVNNGMYGTIRMHQEKRFPGRISATKLQNPDFVAMAKAFGTARRPEADHASGTVGIGRLNLGGRG
ncbi:thiamine pyrophosphate protein [Mycobacteroides abscessus subsp. abscessus]|nr:thiamine pyrophosphate protein [Mycobacteroides abscessus subsp. abscessus]